MWIIYALLGLSTVAAIVMCVKTKKLAWVILAGLAVATIISLAINAPWWVHVANLTIAAIAILLMALRSVGRRVGPIVALLLTTIIVSYTAMFFVHNFNETHVPGTPNAETIKALTVLKPDRSCKKSEFNIGALKSVDPDGRQRSDATSTPFDSADPTKMVGEVKTAVCTDPLYGAQVMNFLANLKLGSFKVVSANLWLNDFKGDAAAINAAASKYVALRDKKHPTKAEVAEMSKLENEWRTKANLANALLDRFGDPVVRTGQPTLSYHLLGTGSVISGLPAVALNDKQQTRSSLQLTLTPKGESNCVMVVGFDITTKDLGQYPCPS